MKRPWFVPSPISLLCAVLTYVMLGVFTAAATVLVPQLLELLRTAPHLAMLAILGFVVSPGVVVVMVHHLGHRSLDTVDRAAEPKPFFPRAESFWAGAHAWLTLYGTSVLTSLVLLVITPPKPEPDASFLSLFASLARNVSLAHPLSLHSAIWIVIATQIYELERRARKR